MRRFVPWILVALVVASVSVAAVFYVRHRQLQDEYGELRYKVTFQCKGLEHALQFAADEYRAALASLSSSGSGADLLRAEIAVDATPTLLGGNTTHAGRQATGVGLLRQFLFCSSLRRSSPARDAVQRRFSVHNQVYREATDRSAVLQALTDMAKDVTEAEQLPLQ